MSVFISYNHNDSEFVDKLAIELLRNNVKVWKDKWKIETGDSFIDKIEAAIEDASFLIIVLSSNSVKSDWVKKELNAALIREIDDKKIKILPIKIDDCKVPLFLREKLYADFRNDFEEGLHKILSVVTQKYNLDGGGRVKSDTSYYFDFTIDHGFSDKIFYMSIDTVSFDSEEDFSILTQFEFLGSAFDNSIPLNESLANEIKVTLLRACGQEFHSNPGRITLSQDKPVKGNFTLDDENRNIHYDISYNSKRLGNVSGGTVIINVGALLVQICDNLGIEYK